MWVFGYGSLIWDDWHKEKGCLRTEKSVLKDYCRRFNKASVKNWGTNDNPGPTLNIESSPGQSVAGIAFEFPDSTLDRVLEYLRKREGKAFELQRHVIEREDGSSEEAYVPVYIGKNILEKDTAELAVLASTAVGSSGKCIDYVINIETKLRVLGIHDENVEQFAELVKEK